MARKTTITKDEFAAILSAYDLGTLRSFRPIAAGTVETNVLLKTERGRCVFRYYENRNREMALFETHLIRFLKARHYPCPAVLKDRRGQYVGIFRRKPFAIFEFAEGRHVAHPSSRQRRQLIEKVAELHKTTRGYRPPYMKYRMNYSVELCRRLAQRAAKRLGTTTARRKREWIERELAALDLPKSLPMGICHADFHFSNVLYKHGRFNALLDFDDANYTYLLFDLWGLVEYAAWHWQDDRVLNTRKARRVLREYARHRPLNRAERSHFFDVYKLGILFDAIWYFARGSADDFFEKRKIEYLNRMGRERFRRKLLGGGKGCT
ncbi:MAG: homoserine kinase [Candidatus Coatesbacteria bacterium]